MEGKRKTGEGRERNREKREELGVGERDKEGKRPTSICILQTAASACKCSG